MLHIFNQNTLEFYDIISVCVTLKLLLEKKRK